MQQNRALPSSRPLVTGLVAALSVASLLVTGCGSETAADDANPAPAATSSTNVETTSVDPAATDPAACTPTSDAAELTDSVSGHDYTALVHRPASSGDVRLPLVIDLHSLFSDGPTQAALTRFADLADQEASAGHGFLVVEPTGQEGPIGGAVGWELDVLDEPDRDDPQYLTRLIDTLVDQHCADPNRVYLAGYSNGGFFASEYACSGERPIAAVASVAGFGLPEGCALQVPVVAFHGTADTVVPYEAGGVSVLNDIGAPPAMATTLAIGARSRFDASVQSSGCTSAPDVSAIGSDVTMSTWTGCAGGATHVFYEIDGGGHTWPGAPEQPDADLVGPTTQTVDATTTIWEFFQQYPVAS